MTELDRYGHPVERVRPERPAPPRPLTPAEVEQIVNLVVAYTRREPDTTMIEVWATQSVIGRWTVEEAARAIHLWGSHRGKGDFLEPSDVTRAIRAERQDRAMRKPILHPDPIGQARIRELTASAFRTVGDDDGDPDETARRAALARPCGFCSARAGDPCTRTGRGGRVRLSKLHPSRYEAP